MIAFFRHLVFGDQRLELSRTEAIQALMQMAQREIDEGTRKGATILYSKSGGKSLFERQTMRSRWSRVIRFGSKGV